MLHPPTPIIVDNQEVTMQNPSPVVAKYLWEKNGSLSVSPSSACLLYIKVKESAATTWEHS